MPLSRSITLRLVRTATVLWISMRFAVVALQGSAYLPGMQEVGASRLQDLVGLSPLGALTLAALVVVATFIDIRVTGERILLANLGVRPSHVTVIVMLVSTALEGSTVMLLQVVGSGS